MRLTSLSIQFLMVCTWDILSGSFHCSPLCEYLPANCQVLSTIFPFTVLKIKLLALREFLTTCLLLFIPLTAKRIT